MTADEGRAFSTAGHGTGGGPPERHCLHRSFEEQVRATPSRMALREAHDFGDVYHELESGALGPPASERLKLCCLKTNAYLHWYAKRLLASVLDVDRDEVQCLNLVGAHPRLHDPVVINDALAALLEHLDGKTNLQALLRRLKDDRHEFVLYTLETAPGSGLRVVAERRSFVLEQRFENLASLVKVLYRANLVEVAGFRAEAEGEPAIRLVTERRGEESEGDTLPEDAFLPKGQAPLSPVLLLGATTGPATVGLLYLGSYLRRHGVEAHCQFYQAQGDRASMEQNLHHLLGTIKPRLVGLSLKWYPHLARGLEMCRLVRKHAPEAKIVVGGDTATFFADELIEDENVDYVMRGDGELPLLKLAMGEREIPNCTYKRNGAVVRTPITYVHDERNGAEFHLSHLDELLVSQTDLFWAPYLYVPTGQGCSMSCFYCAGARENQRRVFNRKGPYLRPIEQVRQDIARAKAYNSTLLFDFDLPEYDSLDYYRRLWEGLGLASHAVMFAFWGMPSPDLVALVSRTFGHASLLIDLCSLSERHRRHLAALGLVKPQPTDGQLLDFFDGCEQHGNVEVTISLISGLPGFAEEDVRSSEKMLGRLIKSYACFRTLAWGPLHAQPGAPITFMGDELGMGPAARTYQEYLECSRSNLERRERSPDPARLHHPLIHYRDERLNALVRKHFEETTARLADHHRKRRRRARFHSLELTFQALNQRANQLANHLRRRGVGPEVPVGLLARRSSERIVGILGVLKAGGTCVPLDPEASSEQLSFVLADSAAPVLLTQEALLERLPQGDVAVICLDRDWAVMAGEDAADLASSCKPENAACLIYTTDSRGMPRKVTITHRRLYSLVMAQVEGRGLRAEERECERALRSSDASLLEAFTTLIDGGTLSLVLCGGLFVLDFSTMFPAGPSPSSGQGSGSRSSARLAVRLGSADQAHRVGHQQEQARRDSHVC